MADLRPQGILSAAFLPTDPEWTGVQPPEPGYEQYRGTSADREEMQREISRARDPRVKQALLTEYNRLFEQGPSAGPASSMRDGFPESRGPAVPSTADAVPPTTGAQLPGAQEPTNPRDPSPWDLDVIRSLDYSKSGQSSDGNFIRGGKVAFGQLPPLLKGTVGLLGATLENIAGEGGVGTALKNYGIKGYQEGMQGLQPLAKDTDDVTVAWDKAQQGDLGALMSWAAYAFGYGGGQMLQAAATAGLGAVVGTLVAPGAGTVAGAAAGLAEGTAVRATAKTVIGKLVEKEIASLAKQATEKGAVGLSEQQLLKQASKNVASRIGQGAAMTGYAGTQEMGSIYGEAVQQKGGDLNGAELARVWGYGAIATGLESATDMLGLGAITGRLKLPGSIAGRGARGAAGAVVGAGLNSGTEALQTVAERLGAGQEVGSPEGIKDIINSAAMGALPGGALGGVAGALNRAPRDATPQIDTPLETTGDAALNSSLDKFQAARDEYLRGPSADQVLESIAHAPTVEEAIAAAKVATEQSSTLLSSMAAARDEQRAKGAALAAVMDRQAVLAEQAQPGKLGAEGAQAQAQTALEALNPRPLSDFVDLRPMDQRTAKGALSAERDMAAQRGEDALGLSIEPHPGQPGRFAIARKSLPSLELPAAAGPTPAAAQNRIETAALTGTVAARTGEDAGRQQVITKALKAIELRRGVASPEEARIVQEAGLGTPYDRVDPSLTTRPLTTDQTLQQATGVVPGTDSNVKERLVRAPGDATLVAQEQRDRSDSRMAALAAQKAAPAAAPAPVAVQPPSVAAVMAAWKTAPALRTAEQKVVLDKAETAFPADDLRILKTAVTAPFQLSATDKSRLGTLKKSEARGEGVSEKRTELGTPVQEAAPSTTRAADLSKLPEQSQAKPGEMSKQKYRFLKNLAMIFGKKLNVYESDDPRYADGYVNTGTPDTINLNRNSEQAHLVVFGHELMHLLKVDNPAAYAAITRVIRLKAASSEEFKSAAGIKGDIEEVIADLHGNLFGDTAFWADVFREVAKTGGNQAATKLGGTIMRLVNKFTKALGGLRGFDTAKMVENMAEVRAALQQALANYAKDQYAVGQALYRTEQAEQSRIANPENGTAVSPAPQTAAAVSPVIPEKAIDDVIRIIDRPEKQAKATKAARAEMGDKFSPQRARVWQVTDDNIPTREGADAIVASRQKNGSWEGYDFKVVPSQFHRNGSFQIESLKRPAATQNNASGESAASLEALSRMEREKTLDQPRYRIRRDGTTERLTGPTAVDTHPRPGSGDVIVQKNIGKNKWTVLDQDPQLGKSAVARALSVAEGIRESTKRGQLDNVEAYHWSDNARTSISTDRYGRGLRGSGREEYMNAEDERRRSRSYFYYDKGTGVRPESGVGGVAHKASLNNVYDLAADPLKLRAGTQAKTESAILDAGFDGYRDPLQGTQPGQVIMLGKQEIPVERLPPGFMIKRAEKRAELNVGLAAGAGKDATVLTPEGIKTAIEARGFKVEGSVVHQSNTEPTLVATLDRPMTESEINDLSIELGQDAIAQRNPEGGGILAGPRAADWGGSYNPDYFLRPDGRTDTETEAAPAEEKASAKRAELNVGLAAGAGKDATVLTPEGIKTAIEKRGVKVEGSVVHQSNTEPTLVATLDRPMTESEINDLSIELGQDAIAQRNPEGGGILAGPRAADWGGSYNPDYFLRPDGRTDTETEAAPAEEKASAKRAELNVGLAAGAGKDATVLTPEGIKTAIEKRGVKVEGSVVHQSNTEPTLVATLDRPMTESEINDLSIELGQDAIAQRNPEGGGILAGPRAADWGGSYNPDYFLRPDGRTDTETEAAPAEEKASAKRAELNVGLAAGAGKDATVLTPEGIKTAIEKRGVKVEGSVVHQSNTEPTLVATLDRPMTESEINDLSIELGQDAIAQRNPEGGGILAGPRAADWGGSYNPDYFLRPDGRTDTETEAAPAEEKASAKRETLDPEIVATLGKHIRNLLPAERAKLRRDTAQTLVNIVDTLPSVNEMAAVAFAGRAKRGWYVNSARAIEHVFGAQAPRFAALLAALSPQNGVETNLLNTLTTWKNWVNEGQLQDARIVDAVNHGEGVALAFRNRQMRANGRGKKVETPINEKAARKIVTDAGFPAEVYENARYLIELMGRSVEGTGTEDSVLGAWVNNSLRALNSTDPGKLVLSGPKVNSFMRNLVGFVDEVTNDAWMANYTLVDQKIFSGSLNKALTEPGKGPGYLAMSAQVRAAARRLTDLTGETWTPAEVQETIWSWAKTLYETASVNKSAEEIVRDKEITDAMIRSTPDFRTLFHDDVNEQLLRDAGLGEQVASLRERKDLGGTVAEESGADGEAAPFAADTQERYEVRAARRLDELRTRAGVGKTLESTKRIVGDSDRAYTPAQVAAFGRTGRQVEEPSLKDRVASLRKDLGKKIAQGVADQFAPIKDLTKHGYTLARLSKGAAGAIEAFLHHGKLSLKGGVYDADMTGGAIERVFQPLQGEGEDFLWWVAGNRAQRLSAEDRENLFTPEDIEAYKSLDNGTTKFDYVLRDGRTTRDRTLIYRDALANFDEFNKNALDMAEQSGMIDKTTRPFWEHEFYVPFYRVSDTAGEFVGGQIGKGLVRQQAFKALKGGTDKLNSDLLANTLMNWSHLIDAAAKNRAAQATLEAAANQGVAVEADEATIRAMGKAGGKAVWFMDGGAKRSFLVEDPYLLAAINGLEYAGLRGPLMDAMSTMKHWLTVGVTASPAFKIKNLIRDSLQAMSVSDLSLNPIANVVQGYKGSAKTSQNYVSSLAGGGLIRFGTMLEGKASERVRQLVAMGVDQSTILDSESKISHVRHLIEKGFMAYSEIGNRSEEINRAALYEQLIAKGVSHAEANLMARDLLDFSMQGAWTSVRFLTQIVPFMNARIQGLYKLGRGAKDDPKRFATVLAGVGVASLALLALYHDDDDWKKREDWDRDNNWWFKVGGVAYRIPKPFELGAIASLAERGVELFTNDEMTRERFLKRVGSLIGDNLSMNPIPQAVKPILDIYANKDSFTGRPIETMGMEKLAPEYRFTQGTSMPARGLSTATGGALSPVQIDHLVQGYFSWLGSFAVAGADMLVRPLTNEPTRPTADYYRLATQGIARELPENTSRYVSTLYDQAKELEQAYGTWQSLMKQGKMIEARDFFESKQSEIAKYRQVESVKKTEARINEQIRMVERSALDPDTKKDRIRVLRDLADRSARQVTAAP